MDCGVDLGNTEFFRYLYKKISLQLHYFIFVLISLVYIYGCTPKTIFWGAFVRCVGGGYGSLFSGNYTNCIVCPGFSHNVRFMVFIPFVSGTEEKKKCIYLLQHKI